MNCPKCLCDKKVKAGFIIGVSSVSVTATMYNK